MAEKVILESMMMHQYISEIYQEGTFFVCASLTLLSRLAATHALETSSIGDVPLQVRKPEVVSAPNPYILPFAMRGLLEEDYVRTQLQDETQELLRQFDNWKPSSKVLRDVKFRLEGVRSKL